MVRRLKRRRKRTAGATPELILHRETGLHYQPGRPDELADAVQYLAEHREEAEAMGLRGRERAEKEFDPAVYEERVGALVHEIGSRG